MIKNIICLRSWILYIVVDNSRHNYSSHTIISAAIKLCYCWDHIPDCSLHNLSRTLFPGQTLEVEVAYVDEIEQPVPCNIQSDFDMNNIELGQRDQYLLCLVQLVFKMLRIDVCVIIFSIKLLMASHVILNPIQ